MPHHVMQRMEVMSASPYHTVSLIKVKIDNDPRAREIYKTGSTKVGNTWVDLYTLAKIGLDRLMIACGMEQTKAISEKREERLWWASYDGTYMQPDGKSVPVGDEKEIDLRVGGSRWQSRVDKEIDKQVKKAAPKHKLRKEQGESVSDFLVRAGVLIRRKDPEGYEEIVELARAKADRFVNQLSQFGLELAKTGARLRAVRTVMEIKSYTLKELEEDFIVVRSRYDWEKLQAEVGPEARQRIAAVALGRAFGMTEGEAIGLISAPEPAALTEEADETAFNGEALMESVEFTEVTQSDMGVEEPQPQSPPEPPPAPTPTKAPPPVPEPKAGDSAFTQPIDPGLVEWLKGNYAKAKFPNLGSQRGYTTDRMVGVESLTHGEGCNLRRFVEELAGKPEASGAEVVELKKNLKAIVLRHNEEQKLWIADEDHKQLTLPETEGESE